MINKFCKKYHISIETIENYPIEITSNGVLLQYVKNGSVIATEMILKGKAIETIGERFFYDIECLTEHKQCIITDSYIEKLSYNEAGYENVISTPYAAAENYSYIDSCIDYFESINIVYLAISNKKTESEIARRIGKVKCKVINYNDNISANNIISKENAKDIFNSLLSQSDYYPIDGIFIAKTFKESVLDIYKNGLPSGAISMFPSFNELVQFYPGMLVLLYGYPSHGKTTFLNQLLYSFWSLNNWKTGIYSPEYWKKELHYLVMAETIVKKPSLDKPNVKKIKMTADELGAAMDYMNYWFYKVEPDGCRTIDDILNKEIELVKRYGINCFVIDPWATITYKSKSNENKADYIAETLYKIKRIGSEYGVCNIMVAHPKSPDTKTGAIPPPPQMRDISGGASFINLGDIGICIYRNRLDNDPDVTSLIVQKNRMEGFTGKTGIANLIFDEEQYCFVETDKTINHYGEIQS